MNQRIKLLAEQALIEFMDENEYATVILPDLLSQKFAELIVRECIDTAFHKGHPDLEFLLKHFGVEE